MESWAPISLLGWLPITQCSIRCGEASSAWCWASSALWPRGTKDQPLDLTGIQSPSLSPHFRARGWALNYSSRRHAPIRCLKPRMRQDNSVELTYGLRLTNSAIRFCSSSIDDHSKEGPILHSVLPEGWSCREHRNPCSE